MNLEGNVHSFKIIIHCRSHISHEWIWSDFTWLLGHKNLILWQNCMSKIWVNLFTMHILSLDSGGIGTIVPCLFVKLRDAFKKKSKLWDICPKGGRGSKQNPKCWSILNLGHLGKGGGGLKIHVPKLYLFCRHLGPCPLWYIECSTCPMSTVFIGASL